MSLQVSVLVDDDRRGKLALAGQWWRVSSCLPIGLKTMAALLSLRDKVIKPVLAGVGATAPMTTQASSHKPLATGGVALPRASLAASSVWKIAGHHRDRRLGSVWGLKCGLVSHIGLADQHRSGSPIWDTTNIKLT